MLRNRLRIERTRKVRIQEGKGLGTHKILVRVEINFETVLFTLSE